MESEKKAEKGFREKYKDLALVLGLGCVSFPKLIDRFVFPVHDFFLGFFAGLGAVLIIAGMIVTLRKNK